MRIDLKRFLRFLGREVVPAVAPIAKEVAVRTIANYDVEKAAREFARSKSLPAYLCIELANSLKGDLVKAVEKL